MTSKQRSTGILLLMNFLLVLFMLDCASASLKTKTETSLEVCVWRHGDDGLTVILTDGVKEKFDKSEKYHLGCTDGTSIALNILQIEDWEEIDERFWMTANVELEIGDDYKVTTSTTCWDDDMNICVNAIFDWVGNELANFE